MTEENIDNPTDGAGDPASGTPPDGGTKTTLTPKDPGHPDYDPMKEPRVRQRTDHLFSTIAKVEQEKDTLAKDLQGVTSKIKEIEDKEKSAEQKNTERIVELEKVKADLEGSLSSKDQQYQSTINGLNAKVLAQSALIEADVKTNKLELKGLLLEITEALGKKKAGEVDVDIVNGIVKEFADEKKASAPNDPTKKTKAPSTNTPADNNATETDDMKKLRELAKDPIKNEAEINKLLQKVEKQQSK